MKKVIRLTESDLHRIVKNSVQRIISEGYGDTSLWDEIDQRLQSLGRGVDAYVSRFYSDDNNICVAVNRNTMYHGTRYDIDDIMAE